MPKRKEPELTPEEQFKRFSEAAKKAELTKDEGEFESSFKKVVKPQKVTSVVKPDLLRFGHRSGRTGDCAASCFRLH